MKPLSKAIRLAHWEGQEGHKELNTFLLNYHATLHATTRFPPAQVLFNNRQINLKLSKFKSASLIEEDVAVQENDGRVMEKMICYDDQNRAL